MLIQKLFVQSNCLQGEKLSAYVLWSRDKDLSMEITIPDELEVKEVNNAQVERKEGKIITKKVENNGYLGMILEAGSLEQSSVDADVIFDVSDGEGNTQQEKRTIHLFRPDFEVTKMPINVLVKRDNRGRMTPDNLVEFHNKGEGLAVIGFDVAEESEVGITEPLEMKVFGENFGKDFSEYMNAAKKDYQDYSGQIDNFIEVFTSRVRLTKESLKKLKDVMEDLTELLVADPTFGQVFSSSLFNAFYKNANIITEFETFINYIKSIESNRVIILDPISIVNLNTQRRKFKGEIRVIDRGLNVYPSVPFEIEIGAAEENVSIPIYKLFIGDGK